MVSRHCFASIALLVAATYWPSLVGGGTFLWDDWTEVIHNPLILSPDGLGRIWFSHESTDYWPLTYTVFWLAYRLFGTAPLGYHLLNIGLHVGNCWLLALILRRLAVPYGLVAVLIFAVHPVNVEAVAWMFQVKTTLAAGLSWLSLWCWLDHIRRPRWSSYLCSFAACTAGILTKLSAVTVPVMLLGATLLADRSARSGRWAKPDAIVARALPLAPHFFVAAVLGALGAWIWRQQPITAVDVVRDDTLLERIIGAFHVVLFYLSTALLPLRLSFIPVRWSLDVDRLANYAPPALILILIFATLKVRAQPADDATAPSPRIIVASCWGYVLLALFPVLGFVDIYFMRYAFVADHWQYFALIGELVLLVTWIGEMPLLKARKPLAVSLAAFAIAACCGLTAQRAAIFSREESVWEDAVQKNPSAWLAFNALGSIQLDERRYDEAMANFLRVIELHPRSYEAYNNLGIIYSIQGDEDKAVAQFERALQIKRNYASAWNNLGTIYAERGDAKRAEYHFLQATLNADPDRKADVYRSLIGLYESLDDPQKADFFRQKLREVRPDLHSRGTPAATAPPSDE